MESKFDRTIGLIGKETFNKLQDKTIAVFGLGGVGGTALESLARSGVEKFVIIDFDKVAESNLNRQILYTEKDIGAFKTEVAERRIKQINNNAKISAICSKISTNLGDLLKNLHIDFIVDAIDDVNGKIEIIKYAQKMNIPFIISLGMANRVDPSKVFITKLDKTTDDPLAKKMRYTIRKCGLNTKEINCVFSKEHPTTDGAKLNSMMMVPSSAGLNICSFVIEYFK